MVLMSGTRLAPGSEAMPSAWWELWSSRVNPVRLWGAGDGGQGMAWEYMVSVRLDRSISRLEVYKRALRPALSIKLAATTTEKSRIAPTMTASNLMVDRKACSAW